VSAGTVLSVIPRRRVVVGIAVVTLLASVACTNRQAATNRRPQTGSSTAVTSDGVQQVTVSVDDRYRFSPSTITVHPGRVKITLVHKGTGAPHNLQVTKYPQDAVPLVTRGQTTSSTFTAPSPGSYQFVCTIHVAQGQTGTLIVLPN